MFRRIKAWLLHVANTSPIDRYTFYPFKERLLRKYGTFRGHQLQQIEKSCWGPYSREYGEREGCPGKGCPHCGGTGVYDLRWVRLERWEWHGHVFHRPVDDSRKIPSPYPPENMIRGLVKHKDYGRLAYECSLWLYLLCGEWRLLWHALTCQSSCGWYWYPMLNVQRMAMRLSMWLSWRRCWCGRLYPTWGTGWQICRKCRKQPNEMPF